MATKPKHSAGEPAHWYSEEERNNWEKFFEVDGPWAARTTKWTIEDLRKAQLPSGMALELLAATVQHLQRRDRRLAELVLQVTKSIGDAPMRSVPGHPEIDELVERSKWRRIQGFASRNLSRGKQKPRTRWSWYAGLVMSIEWHLRDFSRQHPHGTSSSASPT